MCNLQTLHCLLPDKIRKASSRQDQKSMTVGVDRPDFRMFVLGYPADAFVPLAKRETKERRYTPCQ